MNGHLYTNVNEYILRIFIMNSYCFYNFLNNFSLIIICGFKKLIILKSFYHQIINNFSTIFEYYSIPRIEFTFIFIFNSRRYVIMEFRTFILVFLYVYSLRNSRRFSVDRSDQLERRKKT